MNNDLVSYGSAVISGTGAVITTVQPTYDPILNVMVAIIAIISGILSILFTVYRWYKASTSEYSDGGKKITIKEVLEGIEEVSDTIEEVKKNGNKHKGN